MFRGWRVYRVYRDALQRMEGLQQKVIRQDLLGIGKWCLLERDPFRKVHVLEILESLEF